MLASLAGSRNKMGELVSDLVRAASESGRIPAVHDLDTLKLMVLGATAELKAVRSQLEQLEDFVGSPRDMAHTDYRHLSEGLAHMLAKEQLIHAMDVRLIAIDGYPDGEWGYAESDWKSHAHRVGSKEGILLVDRVKRIEEALNLEC